MPKRQCLLCNQPAIDGGSRCSAHARPSNWLRGKRSKSADYYASTAWQSRRKAQLAKEPLCAMCGERAGTADHITNMASGGDPNGPLQSLCIDCHRKKTGSEGHRARYPKKT
jgi:5-methylcytosine-specific restriction protein A